MKRILIFGDRNWDDWHFFIRAMQTWIGKHGYIETIIEGCARGADQMAGHRFATLENNAGFPANIYVAHYPAQWEQHDSYGQTCWCKDKSVTKCRGAGPLRNQFMLTDGKPEAGIAFHKNLAESRGTADMKRRLERAGIPVWVPYPQPQQELFPVEHQDSGIATDF